MATYESDIQQIKFMLENVSKVQGDMFQDIHTLKNEVIHIKNTLIGNAEYKVKGLVDEVEVLKSYVSKDKMLKSKIWGGLSIIGILWTLLLKYLTEWYKLKT